MYWNYLKAHALEIAILILVIVMIALFIYKKKKEGFIDSELWLRRRPDGTERWEDSTYGSIYDSDNLFTGYPFYDKAY